MQGRGGETQPLSPRHAHVTGNHIFTSTSAGTQDVPHKQGFSCSSTQVTRVWENKSSLLVFGEVAASSDQIFANIL